MVDDGLWCREERLSGSLVCCGSSALALVATHTQSVLGACTFSVFMSSG